MRIQHSRRGRTQTGSTQDDSHNQSLGQDHGAGFGRQGRSRPCWSAKPPCWLRASGAEVAAVFAPADVADLMPWMGEGFMGGVQIAAVESLKEAAEEGRRARPERPPSPPCAYAVA